MEKKCTRCSETKPLVDFIKRKSSSSGYGSHCISCESKRARINKYGISEGVYSDLLIAQNDSCRICLRKSSEFEKPLYVDHCHSTGVIRGLLCQYCNSGLGHFQDNEKILELAIKYIKRGRPIKNQKENSDENQDV